MTKEHALKVIRRYRLEDCKFRFLDDKMADDLIELEEMCANGVGSDNYICMDMKIAVMINETEICYLND